MCAAVIQLIFKRIHMQIITMYMYCRNKNADINVVHFIERLFANICMYGIIFKCQWHRYSRDRDWHVRQNSGAGKCRSHAPERCIFLTYIFGSPKGSIYQIFMFPARNIFSMVFLAAILAAILDFQRPSWIYINQHNFKTNHHRETNDTNFSCYFDTTNPFAMLFL